MVGKSSGADTKTINLAARNQTGQLIFCQGRALYRLLYNFEDIVPQIVYFGNYFSVKMGRRKPPNLWDLGGLILATFRSIT